MNKRIQLEQLIANINESGMFLYTFKLGRRNGNYYVDSYDNEGNFMGPINVGNYIETWYYLRGLRAATWEIKPF